MCSLHTSLNTGTVVATRLELGSKGSGCLLFAKTKANYNGFLVLLQRAVQKVDPLGKILTELK